MIREVDLVSYLPPFMTTYKEPVEALEAENPEFYLVWSATDRILKNRFISTADEYGISRFEKMLGIYPSAEDTLESRRSRIQSKWFNAMPYTMRTLLSKLKVLCGDTDFTLTHNFDVGYTLTLKTNLEKYGQVEELESILATMLPENIVVKSLNVIPWETEGFLFLGGGMCAVDMVTITNDFRESNDITGTAVTGGGAVHTDVFNITQDFIEQYQAEGEASVGGGVVHTDMKQISDAFKENVAVQGNTKIADGVVSISQNQISQDFNETIRADADAKIASGTVMVDFFEIKSD